jgi:hypothetical protein
LKLVNWLSNIPNPIKVLGTLLLSSLSNPLWSDVLRPFLIWCGNTILQLAGCISASFLDYVYSRVGIPETDTLAIAPYFVCIGIALTLPLINLITLQKTYQLAKFTFPLSKNEEEFKIFRRKKNQKLTRISYFTVILAIISAPTIILNLVGDIYSRSARLHIERSLDIIGPFLTEQNRLELRSKFRMINNTQSFRNLNTVIRTIADRNKIELPEFTVL